MDPSVKGETELAGGARAVPGNAGGTERGPLLRVRGELYVRSLKVDGLVNCLGMLQPDDAAPIPGKLPATPSRTAFCGVSPGSKLTTLVLEVMPHFVRRRTREGGGRPTGKDILEEIRRRFDIPESFPGDTGGQTVVNALTQVREETRRRIEVLRPPADEPIAARELKGWLLEAVRLGFLDDELSRMKSVMADMGRHPWMNDGHRAVLAFLCQRGALEMDGFGFYRHGSADEFIVYVHTGDYALQDFYGRVYRFPDCRVAVTTWGPPRPFVLDRYRHPFLESDGPGQPICFQDSGRWNGEFSAGAVIGGIEGGINALFHGYDRRRRNGYHSLDPLTPYERTIRFEDLRIDRDHPDIRSGRLEIKNLFR